MVKNVRPSSSSISEGGSAIRPVRSLKGVANGRYSEDDDYVAYKNVDPLMQKENEIVKRNSRRSAQEASKRLKRNFDVSSDDE